MKPAAPPDAHTHEHARNRSAERAYQVERVLLRLGPGPHPLADVITRSLLPRTTVHRILKAGLRAGTYTKPAIGFYAIAATPEQAASPEYLVALPASEDAISDELSYLQRRTGQVAALHGFTLLGPPTRFCAGIEHGGRSDFAAALSEGACAALRSARLRDDAAGLVILANLEEGTILGSGLRSIRIQGHAVTRAPVPNWSMLSAPLRRGRVVVGSVSLLAPEVGLARRNEHFINVTMEAAARISGHLERDSRAAHRAPAPIAHAA